MGAQRRKRLLPLGRCGEVPGRGGICVQPARKIERSPRREKREGHQNLGKQLGQRNRERRRFTISASAFFEYPFLIESFPNYVKQMMLHGQQQSFFFLSTQKIILFLIYFFN